MNDDKLMDISYFPGCSLSSTARENNESLKRFCHELGYNLVTIDDWNCCGSSSAHSINSEIALDLASRNLSLADSGRPLLAACPSCLLRLKHAQGHLVNNPDSARRYENLWEIPVNPDLEIIHFFDLLDNANIPRRFNGDVPGLKGLKFVPYHGCMLSRPPSMNREKNYHGLMEKILTSLGGKALSWGFSSRCCGTFLSVAKPEKITPIINTIVQGAIDAKADCIVTACAMCHLNLEIRCTLKNAPPILHFSELLSMAAGLDQDLHGRWLSRHLIDPRPALTRRGVLRN